MTIQNRTEKLYNWESALWKQIASRQDVLEEKKETKFKKVREQLMHFGGLCCERFHKAKSSGQEEISASLEDVFSDAGALKTKCFSEKYFSVFCLFMQEMRDIYCSPLSDDHKTFTLSWHSPFDFTANEELQVSPSSLAQISVEHFIAFFAEASQKRKSGELCDFHIVSVDDSGRVLEKFAAHKLILFQRCPFLETLGQNNTFSINLREQGLTPSDIDLFLEMIYEYPPYDQKKPFNEKECKSLSTLANLFKCADLFEMAQAYRLEKYKEKLSEEIKKGDLVAVHTLLRDI